MYKLFLDDERKPVNAAHYTGDDCYFEENWIIACTFKEFFEIIEEKGMPELISFDHDLDSSHYEFAVADYIPYEKIMTETGFHILLALMMYCYKNNVELPEIKIHTMNITGEKNLKNLISVYKTVLKSQL